MFDNVCCCGGSGPGCGNLSIILFPINEAELREHQRYSRDEVG